MTFNFLRYSRIQDFRTFVGIFYKSQVDFHNVRRNKFADKIMNRQHFGSIADITGNLDSNPISLLVGVRCLCTGLCSQHSLVFSCLYVRRFGHSAFRGLYVSAFFLVLLQQAFLFQPMNDFCTSSTKILIILFLNKENFVISIFCAKNRMTVERPQRYYFNFLSSYAFSTAKPIYIIHKSGSRHCHLVIRMLYYTSASV